VPLEYLELVAVGHEEAAEPHLGMDTQRSETGESGSPEPSDAVGRLRGGGQMCPVFLSTRGRTSLACAWYSIRTRTISAFFERSAAWHVDA
tara:strand:- start:717 stop:989 length:273 start_codon:yes stop_codon:yes gene_type:complete